MIEKYPENFAFQLFIIYNIYKFVIYPSNLLFS